MKLAAAAILIAMSGAGAARADAGVADSGKLLLTGGVSDVEGAGGGGLATWAPITGYETRDQIGANIHATDLKLPAYELRTYGVAVGFRDRLELSIAKQVFDTGATGRKLGLGEGFTFDQTIYGAKLRLLGDVVYDQDSLLPEVSVGVQHKVNDKAAIIHALGGRGAVGDDYYIAATKLFLAQSLLLDATVRFTKANQGGLLGFGGNRSNDYAPQFEGSIAYLLTKHIAFGGEYRTKPDNLSGLKEDAWYDVFAAYAINKHLSVTLAYASLGEIATFEHQNGLYVSVQAGF